MRIPFIAYAYCVKKEGGPGEYAPFWRCSSIVAPPPENAYLLILDFISLGLSLTKMELLGMLALILPLSPCATKLKFHYLYLLGLSSQPWLRCYCIVIIICGGPRRKSMGVNRCVIKARVEHGLTAVKSILICRERIFPGRYCTPDAEN